MDWTEAGYPRKHREQVHSTKRYAQGAFLITGTFLVLTIIGMLYDVVPPIVVAVASAMFLLFGLLGSLLSYYDTVRYVRVMLYFERKLGGIDTFLAGYALARCLKQLDALAIDNGVLPISSFGFADDLRGETLVWHDAKCGLQCVAALHDVIDGQTMPASVREAIQSDLLAWQQSLMRAAELDVRFCVLLMHGNTTSGHEWDVRKGSAF